MSSPSSTRDAPDAATSSPSRGVTPLRERLRESAAARDAGSNSPRSPAGAAPTSKPGSSRRLTDGKEAPAGSEGALVGRNGPPPPNPFSPQGFLRALEDMSAPVRDFFSRGVLPMTLVPIPTFLDEREMLRNRLHELEDRLAGVEESSSSEAKALKLALAKAESALEASKLERAKSAVETMRHWRQHRKEVEQLRADQAALLAAVSDLKAARQEAAQLRVERDVARLQAESLAAKVAQLEAQLKAEKGRR
jgi:hypothetical protein